MLVDDSFVQIPVTAAASVPTPPTGFARVFFDASNANRCSQKDSAGAVIDLASIGSGGFTNTIIASTPSADQQDWSLGGLTGYNTIKATPADNSFIGGIVAGTTGQILNIVNDSTSSLIWLVSEDSTSAASNRLSLRRAGVFLLPSEYISLIYNTTSSRWEEFFVSNDVLSPNDKSLLILPNTTTSVVSIGVGATANTATLSTIAPVATPTNDITESAITQITNATAAGSSDVRGNALNFMRGATAGRQGVFFNSRFRNTALGATGGFILGMTNSAAAITTQARATNNTMGIGTHGGETVHSIYSRDATAATAVSLGASFPAASATAAFEVAMLCMPNVANMRYMVRRLDSEFKAQGTITTNLPANTLGLAPRIGVMVGATATASTGQFSRIFSRSVS